ncbi:hypothetical protein Sango_1741500 [Sesamum angolense]|uniref:Uncharacterized protein n=1 Tax=Sesamum angolense TaxID=2727404 RepID=A0AAE1WLY9_9LAMI|nr:hypothetical protein Sango_1741500 [Sesamum angolense]
MLYWKDEIDLDYFKFCGEARYKPMREQNPNRKKTSYAILRYLPLTHPLQRLYASEVTVEQMTWHANHQMGEESMCHLSDAEACRYFDQTYLNFAAQPRNVTLGLCTNGFAPIIRNKKAFTKNRVERKVASIRLKEEHIHDWVEESSLAVEVPLSLPDGYGSEHKWTKKSIFWELEY